MEANSNPPEARRRVSVPSMLMPGSVPRSNGAPPPPFPGDIPIPPRPVSEVPSAAPSPTLRNRASTGMLNPAARMTKRHEDLVMDTNNSSIVSKRSVEKLYYAGQPEYFRYFVSKFKRRSPLINRGYWLRMKSVEHAVTRFLAEQTPKKKLVVNLGCGYDPMPFCFLGRHADLCQNTTFVDVDFPVLMQNKMAIISKTEQLNNLVSGVTVTDNESGLLGSSPSYVAVGCDLRNLDLLGSVLEEHLGVDSSPVAIMFVAEVSIAYMEREASQAVIQWAASYEDVRFCLLEQHLPDGQDHPFAMTMVSHFNKLRTPLHTLGTMEQMQNRFVSCGWPENALEAHSLWELWSEPTFMSPELRRSLDTIEPFDEWEEFALFASHYFLLVAERKADQDYSFKPHRASLAASRMSVMSSPLNTAPTIPDLTELDPTNFLNAQELPTAHVPRRFSSLIPPATRGQDGDAIGLHGGLGTQERLDDCDTYSWFDTAQHIEGPPLRTGIMCHTVTRLGGTTNCMLVGGRTSPDKALADCWLRQDGIWSKVASLTEGRYRHCAVPLRLPTEPRPAHTVMLYGGKTSDGTVLDEWLLWTGEQGWQTLRAVGEHPCARFGAAMITDKAEGISGIIVGGLTAAGKVLNDFWHWNLQPDMSVTCQNVTQRASTVLKNNAWILGRFGAQLVRSDQGILLVGGVAGGRMLTRNEQILNMRALRTMPVKGARQLYVGTSVQDVDGGFLILGGGATCFSFGTFWNKSCMLSRTVQRHDDMTWQLVSGSSSAAPEPKTLIAPPDALSPVGDGGSNRASPIDGDPKRHTTVETDSRRLTTVDSDPRRLTTLEPSRNRLSPVDGNHRGLSPVDANGRRLSPIENYNRRFTSSGNNSRGLSPVDISRPVSQFVGDSRPISSMPSSFPAVSISVENGHNPALPSPIMIPKVQLVGSNAFHKYLDAALPVVISDSSFGRCSGLWTNEYLKEAVGNDREVVIHAATSDKMDFQNKNFTYITQNFGAFIDAAAYGEKVYLRSLSKHEPSKRPANLADDFPEIARDFTLPEELAYVVANAHSTPLRISGPVTMWLHYDVMDNVLCQIRGRKRVILFPPSDVAHLGFEAGASSSSLDVFGSPNPLPSLARTHPHEATLEPGDALFIPSTWAHTAAPTEGMSVAVNVFFRGMQEDSYAAGRDVYGNRDLAAYERGRKDVARIVKSFEDIPPHVSGFYLERLAMELLERARTTSKSAGEQLHSVYAELGS